MLHLKKPNTVRLYQRKRQTETERRLGLVPSATCGLTLANLGCLTVGRRGYLSPLGPLPAALMNLPRSWEWLMHLFM